eukprot:CAMPEP_0182453952 /NCGR_PEP_ID=MMETSP1319-20130603/789_1 /TAXON_ID=172717 /ORGANISM="Bolidomonas pacifica, Strain RCC208" /LENGTH=449 /DNA_ID=CAMNT_0024651913 /DNA_START=81 /DNA_END=1427 /DNA_ORIENTATION=+
MAYRSKRPSLSLDLCSSQDDVLRSRSVSGAGSDMDRSQSSDATPYLSNLSSNLPASRYSDLPDTGRSSLSSQSSSSGRGATPLSGVAGAALPAPAGPNQTSQSSDSTFRSPALGLSIGSDFIRIHGSAVRRGAGKGARPAEGRGSQAGAGRRSRRQEGKDADEDDGGGADDRGGGYRESKEADEDDDDDDDGGGDDDEMEGTLKINQSKPWSKHLQHMHPLGRGACSTVYKSCFLPSPPSVPPPRSRTYYAVKSVQSYNANKTAQILQEITLLSSLECPCLVQFEGAYFSAATLSLVLEYMDYGSLESAPHPIPPLPLSGVVYQLFYGLSYLHWDNLTHRDIKPSNVLLSTDGCVKISDFGCSSGRALNLAASRRAAAPMNSTIIGTGKYMSPERLRGQRYDAKADVWSAGLVVVEVARGVKAFERMGHVEILMTVEEWDGKAVKGLVE